MDRGALETPVAEGPLTDRNGSGGQGSVASMGNCFLPGSLLHFKNKVPCQPCVFCVPLALAGWDLHPECFFDVSLQESGLKSPQLRSEVTWGRSPYNLFEDTKPQYVPFCPSPSLYQCFIQVWSSQVSPEAALTVGALL